MKLQPHLVEKPWGRTELPEPFGGAGLGRRIGEIEFGLSGGPELPPAAVLVKYIFTSGRLSVQVHPDDAQARARGLTCGKCECWYVLAADPGASLALGFRASLDEAALRRAALDGSIVDHLDWKPAHAGDFFYVPPGTVHASGGRISLIEIQQPSDVTYRLYDYGRPRELQLEDGLAVTTRGAYPGRFMTHVSGDEGRTLVSGPHFRVEYVVGDGLVAALEGTSRWVLPIRGAAATSDEEARAGDCLVVPAGNPLRAYGNAALLVAAGPGGPSTPVL